MKKLQMILILMVVRVSLAQDMTLDLPWFTNTYTIPVDTTMRRLYLGQEFMEWDWPGGLWHLEFTFHNEGSEPIEYTFAGLIQADITAQHVDTVDFQITGLSMLDSIQTGEFMTPNGLAYGFKYYDFPGDSISGFTLDFPDTILSTDLNYHTLWYRADTISDWSQFQPLALGNVWKFAGPFPVHRRLRLEVIDTATIGNNNIFTIVRQRDFLPDYGTGLELDTGRVYTPNDQAFKVRYYDGAHINSLITYFEPMLPPESTWEFEGMILMADGSTDYGYFELSGTGYYWRYGIGFHKDTGDPFGTITNLIGYRVGDEEWGDIDVLVGIEDEPQTPTSFQLSVYPNPFNPSTTIAFNLVQSEEVSIEISDITGRQVARLLEKESLLPGTYTKVWNADDSASGVYFVRINAGHQLLTQKIILVK